MEVSFEGSTREPVSLVYTANGGLIIKGTHKQNSVNVSPDILIGIWDETGSAGHYLTDGSMPAKFSKKSACCYPAL